MDETADKLNEAHLESDYHRQDEQVNVCLECNSSNLAKLQRRFIRCSSQATITHLKKFVAKKVFDGIDKYREVSGSACIPVPLLIGFPCLPQVDILCNDALLGKDHTLKFIYVTRWRPRDPPLILQYRPRIDTL